MNANAIRERLGTWWWALLVGVVAVSIAVSSIRGPAPSSGRSESGRTETATQASQKSSLRLTARWALSGDATVPFDFERCLRTFADEPIREARHYCLADAHLFHPRNG